MSALPRSGGAPGLVPARRLDAMAVRHVDAVMAVEAAAYPFPWTRGNFIDSLASGYEAQVLVSARAEVLGYFIAMPGVEEMHLLNITVAPGAEGRGHASFMFAALRRRCGECGALELWLEVREANARARAIYRHLGFAEIGTRKAYYPAAHGRREDAVVMSLQLAAAPLPDRGDALA